MTQSTLTQQALPVDEQSVAQEELNDLLATQSETVAPTQDPLTHRDACGGRSHRQIIATIINSTPDQIKTIWIEGGITVWVQLSDSGRLPFDRTWFASRVAEVKPTIAEPETPRQRNERLYDELEKACSKFSLYHNQVNWLSFSAKVYRGQHLVGFVGCNQQGWYSRPRQYGVNRIAQSAEDAIKALGVKAAVAA
ncbi:MULTISPECIES: hypothetical protein [Nostoc]|uniref:Uncharacterized protein n=1 Tax=Nostoc paludosum FACHB-159 TaxID=2692908 RepID=A0ABR8KM70_9NOSO|nr:MULTISPECIES: hypothetical protein [Nostoc]MBD2683393.1 hypothetical protein [Nostoc sp. FACHB-857]MBD2739711.1 hypothetical protein [Nostoc paludosum FACHB-159]